MAPFRRRKCDSYGFLAALTSLAVAKGRVSSCRKACFATRFGRFRVVKRHLSHCEKASFATHPVERGAEKANTGI